MSEAKEYYSPDEVAELLGLHVRTVRRFIGEGKLKAARVGKQYRIAKSDVRALAGSDREGAKPQTKRRIIASTTVDVDAIGPGEQARLVSLLSGAFHSLEAEPHSRRFDAIYYAEERRLRLLINADLEITNVVLSMLRGLLEGGSEMMGDTLV